MATSTSPSTGGADKNDKDKPDTGAAKVSTAAAAAAAPGVQVVDRSTDKVTDYRDGTAPARSALPGEAPVGLPTAGGDPDSIARQAKAQLGSGTLLSDDAAADHIDRAARARALIQERNGSGPERVKEIDAELAGLGFTDPLPTTVAQRGAAPAGRQSPQGRQAQA